ncbi:glyoxalase [Bradyrhizobium canariense]|uniref:VOC family protein n=1 Tax=Bradyrhizobium canariense TaxID=255045 RepID=UPI001CA5777A|nr:VOC family protein [Bradyrhizobium canariense]MBW5440502.1 glyoxalase [Bradyrhizobium canariense]
MKIVGLDTLIFGVEDLAIAGQFFRDYGAIEAPIEGGLRFEALDGTGVEFYPADDARLPAAPVAGCQLRKTVMGVSCAEDLEAIRAEVSKDREVRSVADQSIECMDNSGFLLGFQPTIRKAFHLPSEQANAPGAASTRQVNRLGVDANQTIAPRTLSHIVYFVPDVAAAEEFYVRRLGFRCTDRFEQVGPFLQPMGTLDHHTHFLIGAPPHMQGVEHFAFHFGGPTDVMLNGSRFVEKGYQPFWGPGRHLFGSNWFWYFNSPFGCHVEMDADMDLHDASWRHRTVQLSADTSQAFLTRVREKWSPGPGTPKHGAYA